MNINRYTRGSNVIFSNNSSIKYPFEDPNFILKLQDCGLSSKNNITIFCLKDTSLNQVYEEARVLAPDFLKIEHSSDNKNITYVQSSENFAKMLQEADKADRLIQYEKVIQEVAICQKRSFEVGVLAYQDETCIKDLEEALEYFILNGTIKFKATAPKIDLHTKILPLILERKDPKSSINFSKASNATDSVEFLTDNWNAKILQEEISQLCNQAKLQVDRRPKDRNLFGIELFGSYGLIEKGYIPEGHIEVKFIGNYWDNLNEEEQNRIMDFMNIDKDIQLENTKESMNFYSHDELQNRLNSLKMH